MSELWIGICIFFLGIFLTGCGQDSLVTCDSDHKRVGSSCVDLSDDEKAMKALDRKDFATAKAILVSLVEASPAEYFRYPRLGAVYAGLAGFDLVNLAKANSSGGDSKKTPFDLINDFIPPPSTDPSIYQDRVFYMGEARNILQKMPEAERSAETPFYGSSAELQYTLYQSFYSIMLMNQFVVPTDEGKVDVESLKTISSDQAAEIVENMILTSQLKGNEALGPEVDKALEEINAQGQGTLRENIIQYIAIKTQTTSSDTTSGSS